MNLTLTNPTGIIVGTVACGYRGDVDVKPGDEVKLVSTDGQELSYAEVVDVWRGLLGDVPAVLLEMHQDPLQRTFSGFHMCLALARTSDSEETPMDLKISVVLFKPKTSTLIRPTSGQLRGLGL